MAKLTWKRRDERDRLIEDFNNARNHGFSSDAEEIAATLWNKFGLKIKGWN